MTTTDAADRSGKPDAPVPPDARGSSPQPRPDRADGDGWWADAAFWDEMFDFIFPPDHLALGADLADAAVTRLGLAPPASILDLGCGPGRVCIPLARRGFDVTGIDCQEGLLERARAWARREGLEVTWTRGDIAQTVFAPRHDAVLCVFNSFGYFADPRRDALVLRRAHDALRPGGRLLLETAHRDGVVRNMHVREAQAGDGRRWREEPRFDVIGGILEARWTATRPDGAQATFVSRIRSYTATEIGEMLRASGFSDVAFSADLEGSPPSADSYMIVAVATR